MSTLPEFDFQPVAHEHLPLLASWMKRSHWREWWGEPEIELSYIVDMVEGRDSTRPYLFSCGGQPAGYIQVWFVGDWQNQSWIAENPWLAELPSDAVGVDLSIGEEHMLSRGIGSAVLREFSERLARQGHETIVIDPDPENRRAVRAYEKAGFRPIPRLLGRTGDSLIMQFDLKRNGISQ